jgi:hypothetical protein
MNPHHPIIKRTSPAGANNSLKEAKENPFSLREKARMRGYKSRSHPIYPLSPALSRRERGLKNKQLRCFKHPGSS